MIIPNSLKQSFCLNENNNNNNNRIDERKLKKKRNPNRSAAKAIESSRRRKTKTDSFSAFLRVYCLFVCRLHFVLRLRKPLLPLQCASKNDMPRCATSLFDMSIKNRPEFFVPLFDASEEIVLLTLHPCGGACTVPLPTPRSQMSV